MNLLQRESRASPDLVKSSAMYMATELFIKPSAVIGCFLSLRMISDVFLSLTRIQQFSPYDFLHGGKTSDSSNEERRVASCLGWTTKKYSSDTTRTFRSDLHQFEMDALRERSHGGT